ncbi:MAG: FHA domain-containing protein [Chloroflexota bacterium]|nr:FHA domain-containing protein [Chloroflexota bacterium]
MLSVALEVVSTGREMSLPLDAEILLGRLDAAHGIFPEVDLAADGGLEHGISRRHARIYMRESHCFIEDLDSTNGTFLNDERLTPYLPYRFNDGDALSLGTLQLKIRIHSTE